MPPPLPKSRTLPALTVAYLKEAILAGRWGDSLPPERALALELAVGRGVLRAALATLEGEGWIRRLPRSKTVILSPHTGQKAVLSPERCVIFLSPGGALLDGLRSWQLQFYRDIFNAEREGRVRMLEVAEPRLHQSPVDEVLEALVGDYPNAVWVLMGVPREVQGWFDRHVAGLKAVIVLGHRFPGIGLAAVDVDGEAACWHAATQMARRGCRSITLLQVDGERAGEVAMLHGLQRVAAAFPSIKLEVKVAPRDLRKLDGLLEPLRVAAGRPAGMILGHPHFAIPLSCAALARGVTLGKELYLASIFEDATLALLPGPLVTYSRTALYEKLGELLQRTLRGEVLKPRERLFVPEALGWNLIPVAS